MTALLVLSNGLVIVLLKSSRRPYRDVTLYHAHSCQVAMTGKCTYFPFCSPLTGCAFAQAIDKFVLELGVKETNAKKQRKTTALALDEEEWTWVRLFCNVLTVSHTLLHVHILLMHGSTPACRWCPASLLFFLNTNPSKRTPSIGEDACGMGKSLQQTPLFLLQTSSQRRNGETQWILPAFCCVWCPYHGYG